VVFVLGIRNFYFIL